MYVYRRAPLGSIAYASCAKIRIRSVACVFAHCHNLTPTCTSLCHKNPRSTHEGPTRRAIRTTSLAGEVEFPLQAQEKCDDKMSKIQLRAGICIPKTTRMSIRRGSRESGNGWNGVKCRLERETVTSILGTPRESTLLYRFA